MQPALCGFRTDLPVLQRSSHERILRMLRTDGALWSRDFWIKLRSNLHFRGPDGGHTWSKNGLGQLCVSGDWSATSLATNPCGSERYLCSAKCA